MPVSCFSDNEEPPAKCCKYCDESTESGDGGGGPVSWRLTLDQDLIETLKSSFPSWFPGGGGGGVLAEVGSISAASSPSSTGSPPEVGSPPLASIDSLGLLLSSTSPIAERSNGSNSSSGVSSNESGGGTPALSFRSSSISSTNSFPPSPPSLVIYATQIEQPPGQRAAYKKILADMAEGHQEKSFPFRQPPSSSNSEPPQLHIVDSFNFDALGSSNTRQISPPKAIVDSSPLQLAMDKNKESLKVKLLVRRPITQLVEQGIIPPLKTSPAIHEQRKQLERAKTGDLLKAKIQQRPNRQELERRHILEHEESHVDPSLAEKQRMLKKARLADQLNSQLSHRPGPLELIKKNILHVEEPIERIVKEGLVSFRATSEGLLNRPQHPQSYVTFEDDSQNSSESGSGTAEHAVSPPGPSDMLEVAATSAGIVTVALTIPTSGGAVVVTSGPILQSSTLPPAAAIQKMPALLKTVPPPPPPPLPVPPPAVMEIKTEVAPEVMIKSEAPQRFAELCQSLVGGSTTMSPSPSLVPIYPAAPKSFSFSSPTLCTLSPLSSGVSPQSVVLSRSIAPSSPAGKFDAPGKDKYRKKSKCKPATKARPIKFHEYKGPPNAAQKNSSMSQAQTEETSYQLLLKQQNFLLEYLEGLHKQPGNNSNHNSLQQQQQQPKPQILMMTETNFVQKPSFATISNNNANNTAAAALLNANHSVASPAPSMASTASTEMSTSGSVSSVPPLIDLNRLEKMKVSDLKLQLKKRNLPVSGPKPQLIERLKPFLPLDNGAGVLGQLLPQQVKMENGSVEELCDFDALNSPHLSLSPASEHELMDVQQIDSPQPVVVFGPLKEDLVREQQRKIDELQRKLKESQDELLQMKQNHTAASQVQSKEQPVNQKLIFKQQLEAKIQKEKMQQIENLQRQQKEYLANQQQVLKNAAAAAALARGHKTLIATQSQPVLHVAKAPVAPALKEEAPALAFNETALQQLANKKNVEIVWNGEQALFLVGLQQADGNNNSHRILAAATTTSPGGHQRTNSMPSILVPISGAGVNQLQGPILIQHKPALAATTTKQVFQNAPENEVAVLSNGSESRIANERKDGDVDGTAKKPSGVEGANKKKRVHRNSQMMTDVLEILIKNGDLPESAAQVPVTPSTAVTAGNSMAAAFPATSEKVPEERQVLTHHSEPVTPPPQALEDDDVALGGQEIMGDLDLSTMLGHLADPPTVEKTRGSMNVETVSSRIGAEDSEDHVSKTLDMLLNGHHKSLKGDERLIGGCSGLGANDVVMNNSVTATAAGAERGGKMEADCEVGNVQHRFMAAEDMDHFDEIEFMALMKLDMEIADENAACAAEKEKSEALLHQHGLQQQPSLFNGFGDDLAMDDSSATMMGNAVDTMSTNSLNSRSGHYGHAAAAAGPLTATMDNNGNPSSCPAVVGGDNDLNLLNNNKNHTNNHFADTPMDIEDFSNSLSAFDFPFVVADGATATGQPSHQQQQNQMIGNRAVSFAGMVNGLGADPGINASVNSSSMNFSALQSNRNSSNNNNQNSGGSSVSSNNNSQGSVFGSISALNDQLGMVDVPPSLLYDSHLPMGHDYSLELFDDLRIPTDSMSWNEVDFPIFGK